MKLEMTDSNDDRQSVVAKQYIEEKNYWLDRLSAPLWKNGFPYDNYGKASGLTAAARVFFQWSGGFHSRLMTACSGSLHKFHIMAMTGIAYLLDQYTGSHDIVLSTPIYKPDEQGKFINTVLPLRIHTDQAATFKELLMQVGQCTVEASNHQNYPIRVLLKQIGMPLMEGEPSLLDTAVVVDNIHHPGHCRSIHPKITFSFRIEDNSIKGDVDYNSYLYEESTIRQVLIHLKRILEKVVLDLDIPLSRLSILPDREKGAISADVPHRFPGNNCRRVFIKGYPFQVEKIEKQLLKHPDIEEAAIIVNEPDGKPRNTTNPLYAYFTSGKNVNPSELKEQLARILPHYLVPAPLVRLEKMPSTPLHEMEKIPGALLEMETRLSVRDPYTVPADEVEEKLLNIWAEVLEIEKDEIRLDEGFARWSRQSLKLIDMTSQIHKEFGIIIPIPDVFRLSTITGLAGRIREASDRGKTGYCPIEPAEKKEYYPVSISQKRLYFLNQLYPDSTGYNISQIVMLEGDLDRRRLENGFKLLTQRHEILRTTFHMMDDVPIQKIHNDSELELKYYDLTGNTPEASLEEERKITGAFVRPFDLARMPVLRVELIKKGDFLYVLMVDRHHILSDAASRQILLNDLVALYDNIEISPLKLQYKDFSQWQHQLAKAGKLELQRQFWLEQYKGRDIPVLNIPLDFPRPAVLNVDEGDYIVFSVDTPLWKKLVNTVKDTETTLFMVMFAVYYILLFKYTKQEEIIVGTLLNGRSHPDLDQLIGFFVNTMPILNRPAKTKTAHQFLKEVKDSTLGAYENQNYYFDELVADLGLQGGSSRNPLFDTVFTWDPFNKPHDNHEGEVPAKDNPDSALSLEVLPYGDISRFAKFDLYFQATEMEETVQILLRYSTQLFKPKTIRSMANYYLEVLENITADINVKIENINVSHSILTASSKLYKEDGGDFNF
ncbi:MAG: hypothetical protein GY940_27760 [bacterium]|nr:hypothetical protein [bacterium]